MFTPAGSLRRGGDFHRLGRQHPNLAKKLRLFHTGVMVPNQLQQRQEQPYHPRTVHPRLEEVGEQNPLLRGRQDLAPGRVDAEVDRPARRAQELAGGVAVLKVGGATEVEVKERKDRVDDALHATRAAVEEGVVPGGGVALVRAVKALENVKTTNDDQRVGVQIVRRALSAPARQIFQNAGEDGSVVVGKILDNDTYNFGFNAQTAEYGDLVAEGVIDPAKVVRCALQDAASVAGLLITTEAMVADRPKKDAPAMPMGDGGMGGMGGMGF